MSAVISMTSFNTWNTQYVNLVFRWGLLRISAQVSTTRKLGGEGFKPFSTHCIDLMISIYKTWIWPLTSFLGFFKCLVSVIWYQSQFNPLIVFFSCIEWWSRESKSDIRFMSVWEHEDLQTAAGRDRSRYH